MSWPESIREFLARRRRRQDSTVSSTSANGLSMKSAVLTGDDELKGVRLHPVALVDDFNPKASKAGV